ncbi:MarR family transcriptional regulator [Streptacidiphilus sp. ASG 303]|uniref:MarR family winged helix-turn-helix transcriptional regulator n=1 Tax=Streptacidiphilus sp. ASG 303 TaxID=2896847 RepID=UPI001E597956|nr:MarR family transcriptional regulator [Streptacidiphilus sp. ASG 303]MCD0483664.1 MarR family transcriptional regulator [Streptacidiphilus sp. ASG 303]
MNAADDAWLLMTSLVFAERQSLTQAAAELGLTGLQAQALVLLDPAAPAPAMQDLAEWLACEPSNLTHLVNRLQSLGYVERVPHPTNRRMKTLRLTTEGVKARSRALLPLLTAPAALRALPREDQEALRGILSRIHTVPRGLRPPADTG